MKKIYITPQCVTELIGEEDILTLSTPDTVSAGTFFDYNTFTNGGTQA